MLKAPLFVIILSFSAWPVCALSLDLFGSSETSLDAVSEVPSLASSDQNDPLDDFSKSELKDQVRQLNDLVREQHALIKAMKEKINVLESMLDQEKNKRKESSNDNKSD